MLSAVAANQFAENRGHYLDFRPFNAVGTADQGEFGGNYFDRIHSDGLKRYLVKR